MVAALYGVLERVTVPLDEGWSKLLVVVPVKVAKSMIGIVGDVSSSVLEDGACGANLRVL